MKRAPSWLSYRLIMVVGLVLLVRAFRMLGPLARPAITDLGLLLRRQNDSEAAALALAAIGAEGVPVLIMALTNDANYVRVSTIRVLADIPDPGQAAVPNLMLSSKHRDSSIRGEAMRTLWQIGRDPVLLVPHFCSQLLDVDWSARYWALCGLDNFGTKAKSAGLAVLKTWDDPESLIRNTAVTTLARIDPPRAAQAGAIPILIARLGESDSIGRQSAIELLAEMKGHARPALPALKKAREDED